MNAEEMAKIARAADLRIAELQAENDKLRAVADAAKTLRVDGKGLSIAQANQALDDALAALDEACIQCGKPGPTRVGDTCSRECEKKSMSTQTRQERPCIQT